MSYDQKLAMLLTEASNKGCKIGLVQDKEALEFIAGLKDLHKKKKKIRITRSTEILMEVWSVEVARRRLSEHIRGECGCPKT